jgi:hypothetical protein
VPSVGLADVLQTFGSAYLDNHALPRGAARVWRAIVACRTSALGGYIESCMRCGRSHVVHHSSRNRHCPTCQMRAKEAWVAARQREVLPVPYFHLVFTLPHELNPLVGAVPRRIYETLFAAVSATLTEFAQSPRHLGGQPAFTLVLHTWKQDLGRHVHLHALVAGGALDSEGRWRHPRKGFLFPVRALSKVFRGKFIAALADCRQAGSLPDVLDWPALKQALFARDWVVYAKQPLGGPAAVLDYLGRYTHRVAISNERIVGMAAGRVTFSVRPGRDGKKRLIDLPGSEFIDRFLLHVLPQGFKRIRHYGLLSPARKKVGLAAARVALNAPTPDVALIESVTDFMRRIGRLASLCCPHCGGKLCLSATISPRRDPAPARGPP